MELLVLVELLLVLLAAVEAADTAPQKPPTAGPLVAAGARCACVISSSSKDLGSQRASIAS
jgi:hypothetical protein